MPLSRVTRLIFQAHGLWWRYNPQVLPVEQDGDVLKLEEKKPSPAIFDANDEIFLFTWRLSQAGQLTSLVLELRSSSSNSQPQFSQANSKIGIIPPAKDMLKLTTRAVFH
jgi:hypothetical protein